MDWSILNVVEKILINLISAGILSPTNKIQNNKLKLIVLKSYKSGIYLKL